MTGSGSIAIVGGGLAGSALAADLARAGFEVDLFERTTFPRDKLCGEFLSSETRRLLERLGCWAEVQALGPASIQRARFTSPGGRTLELSLPAPGLGLSRRTLDAALAAHAQRSGAKLHLRSEVREIVADGLGFELAGETLAGAGAPAGERFMHRAELVAGAWGRRSKLDRALGRRFVREAHPHLGFKQHHRPREGALGTALVRELEGQVEIHAVHGGYCGMSFVEAGRVNVCMLLEERFFRDLPDRSMGRILAELGASNTALARRLEALVPDGTELQSVAQVPFTAKELVKEGVFFLGDAAGVVAPLVGDGQAMAIESALLLGALIRERGVPRDRSARVELGLMWRARWQLRFRARMELGRHLQRWLLHGGASDRVLQLLAAAPPVTEALVRLTRSRA